MTEDQRHKLWYERRSQMLADGLAAYKHRNRLTNADLSQWLGVSSRTVAKLLEGEDVKLSVMMFWQLLEVAGLTVKRGDEGNER